MRRPVFPGWAENRHLRLFCAVTKCNDIQVDGISFIEKLSFNAFNEGTRLEHSIKMHKRLFKVDAKKIGGDTRRVDKGVSYR